MKVINAPIYNMLKDYASRNNLRLHMPSHKGKGEWLGKINKWDITELDFSDNLVNPQGVILQAQQLYAQLFGCKQAHFTTNGSSAGVLAMLGLAVGDVLIEKNSHQSVYNALRLYKKKFFTIDNAIVDGMPSVLQLSEIKKAVCDNKSIKTVVLTSPNYYGNVCDLASIYDFLHKEGIMLIVDSAHGACLGLSQFLPTNAVDNCDICVVSTHKTLTALTQTAVVLTNSEALSQDVKTRLNMFNSTSPSYLLLASIDYARHLAQIEARQAFAKLKIEIDNLRVECNEKNIKIEQTDDFSRVVIDVSRLNLTGREAYAQLQANGVVCEMFDCCRVVCIFSFVDDKDDVARLYDALCKLSCGASPIRKGLNIVGGRVNSIDDVIDRQGRLVSLKDSVGQVSKYDVGIVPPCSPLIISGQLIDSDSVKILTDNLDIAYNIDSQGKIQVI